MAIDEKLRNDANLFRSALHVWCKKYEQLFPVMDRMTDSAKAVVLNQLLDLFPRPNMTLHEKCLVYKAAIQADETTLHGYHDSGAPRIRGRGYGWFPEPTIRMPDIPPNPLSKTYWTGYFHCEKLIYPQWLFIDENKAYSQLRELLRQSGILNSFEYRDTNSTRIITRAVHQNWMGLMNTIGEFEISINLHSLNPDDKECSNAALVNCWGFEKNPSTRFPSPRTILKDAFMKITTRQGAEMFKPHGMSVLSTTKETLEKVRDAVAPFLFKHGFEPMWLHFRSLWSLCSSICVFLCFDG